MKDGLVHLRLPPKFAAKLDQIVAWMEDEPDSHRIGGGPKEGRPRALRYLIARVHKELGLQAPARAPEESGG